MLKNNSLEQRLTAVEAEISELKQKIKESQSSNWIQQVSGIFKDEPAFDEIIAYGREIRKNNGFVDELPSQDIEHSSLVMDDANYVEELNSDVNEDFFESELMK